MASKSLEGFKAKVTILEEQKPLCYEPYLEDIR
jgi:hypothetical protein